MMAQNLLTIGQLAKQVNVRTSTLRFYEKEGLLQPNGRSDSGYRLYHPDATQKIYLIQRAQRLGFSLADIRPLLQAWETGNLNNDEVIKTAENRYLALEEQITRRRVQQHELALFLQDLHRKQEKATSAGSVTAVTPNSAFDQLLARICASPEIQSQSHFMFDWLLSQAGCILTSTTGKQLLARLRGQHIHVWQEDEAYHILIVSNDPEVGNALQELAQLEATCKAHNHLVPEFTYDDEGYLFVAQGENAFIYAQLFMALEVE